MTRRFAWFLLLAATGFAMPVQGAFNGRDIFRAPDMANMDRVDTVSWYSEESVRLAVEPWRAGRRMAIPEGATAAWVVCDEGGTNWIVRYDSTPTTNCTFWLGAGEGALPAGHDYAGYVSLLDGTNILGVVDRHNVRVLGQAADGGSEISPEGGAWGGILQRMAAAEAAIATNAGAITALSAAMLDATNNFLPSYPVNGYYAVDENVGFEGGIYVLDTAAFNEMTIGGVDAVDAVLTNLVAGNGINILKRRDHPIYVVSIDKRAVVSAVESNDFSSITLGGATRTNWPSDGETALIIEGGQNIAVVTNGDVRSIGVVDIAPWYNWEGDWYIEEKVHVLDDFSAMDASFENSITLGGVTRTNWPAGGGGGSVDTNAIVAAAVEAVGSNDFAYLTLGGETRANWPSDGGGDVGGCVMKTNGAWVVVQDADRTALTRDGEELWKVHVDFRGTNIVAAAKNYSVHAWRAKIAEGANTAEFGTYATTADFANNAETAIFGASAERAYFGTDENSANADYSIVYATSITLGGETRTNWPGGGETALIIEGGQNIAVVTNGDVRSIGVVDIAPWYNWEGDWYIEEKVHVLDDFSAMDASFENSITLGGVTRTNWPAGDMDIGEVVSVVSTGMTSLAVGTSVVPGGSGSIAVGRNAESRGSYSMVFGRDSYSYSAYGVAIGYGAQVPSGRHGSFCWNGRSANSGDSNYNAKAEGSFCVNPQGGVTNFYIGSQNLSEIISSAVSAELERRGIQ